MSMIPHAPQRSGVAASPADLTCLMLEHPTRPGGFVVRLYLSSLRSEQSRASMAASLRAIARLVAEHVGPAAAGIPVADMDADRVDWVRLDYPTAVQIRSLMGCRWSAATINRHLAALRGVVRVCRLTGLMDRGRAEAVLEALPLARKEYEGENPSARLVSDIELRALFARLAANPHPSARRDAALLAVLAMGAVRRSELVQLDLADWDPGSGSLLVRRGKGGKRRKVWLHSGGADALAAWLDVRGAAPGPLFVPVLRSGRIPFAEQKDPFDPGVYRMSAHAVWARTRRLAADGGVAAFAPHDLRRKVATDLLDDGVDIAAVRILLGHTSIATTALYDRRGQHAARRAATRIRTCRHRKGRRR